jgi:hypothetical protein
MQPLSGANMEDDRTKWALTMLCDPFIQNLLGRHIWLRMQAMQANKTLPVWDKVFALVLQLVEMADRVATASSTSVAEVLSLQPPSTGLMRVWFPLLMHVVEENRAKAREALATSTASALFEVSIVDGGDGNKPYQPLILDLDSPRVEQLCQAVTNNHTLRNLLRQFVVICIADAANEEVSAHCRCQLLSLDWCRLVAHVRASFVRQLSVLAGVLWKWERASDRTASVKSDSQLWKSVADILLARRDALTPKTRDLTLDFFTVFAAEFDSACTRQLLRVVCEILETRMISPMTAVPRIVRWIDMHGPLRSTMQNALNNFTDTTPQKLLLQRLFTSCPVVEAYIHTGSLAAPGPTFSR